MKTEIYCDSADLETIKKLNSNTLVKGFTTNPSLMRLAGAKNYKNYSLKLLKICNRKPISLEVFGDNFDQMFNQANIINSWGNNVYVKIPVVNSKGIFSGKVISALSKNGVKLNITAVYTINQVKKIIKRINKDSKIIISIFSGRMGDIGKDPIPIIKESVRLTKRLRNVKILWASTREPYNYLQAKNCGCSIITMPAAIIEKISKFGKTYQELTLDTVKKFLKDSRDSNFKI
ncbi:MAG TPA: transaldolase [Pelagibacteraceae bacterium]|jgi:transaldolase|nr:transaldolase [Pelagibacteraceae bacterium]|tara:strand:+ start:21 stop:719 length:699 start_codon:yes stop_codon:yes gene_type:complete